MQLVVSVAAMMDLPASTKTSLDDNGPVCVERVLGCPAAWGELPEIAEAPVGDGWSLVGETNENGIAEGSCGGGLVRAVYTFTAPAPATYLFTVDGNGATPTLYLRSACQEPATELACQMAPFGWISILDCGVGGGSNGLRVRRPKFRFEAAFEHTISVSFYAPNVLLAAEAFVNRAEGSSVAGDRPPGGE